MADVRFNRSEHAVRVLAVIKHLGLTKKGFADLIGVASQSTVTAILSGVQSMSEDALYRLKRAERITSDFMLFGDTENLDPDIRQGIFLHLDAARRDLELQAEMRRQTERSRFERPKVK